MSTTPYSRTPAVTVSDNRGLRVRTLAYCRHPDRPDETQTLITRHRYDTRGALVQSADPRLQAAGLANLTRRTAPGGQAVRSDSADAGTTLTLNDAAGRPLITVSHIRTAEESTEEHSQAVTRTWQYEDATLPGRLLSITEQVAGATARISERFVYAGNTAAEQARNLAGQCVSHYDPAGLLQTDSVALTGIALSVTRYLLREADKPESVADWQGTDASAWRDRLDNEAHISLTGADATGAVLTRTDADGNEQRVAYDVAGLLSGSWLTLKGGSEQVIVKTLTYSAAGQKLREEHGNGVVTTYRYEAETQRLAGIRTERPAGHRSGQKVLQDLRYEYDPVGNVQLVRNDAEESRFWRNRKVVPESRYSYDSLYRLVRASGREMASAGQQSSRLPSALVPLPTDSSAYTGYTRTYTYDTADNLTKIRHSAPATGNSYTTDITISARSNRGVLSTLAETPSDVEGLFTPGGQQRMLLPGQGLYWTARDELLKVTPVVRNGSADDRESYRYDASSQRLLKVSVQQTGSSTQTQRGLYLPGLERRTTVSGSTETENLHVIIAGEAGRAQVRVLHWESGRPEGISNDQVRYSYDSFTGSSGLEVDSAGLIISSEEYYPYGGTAVWTARSQAEADYKTLRYSGRERDATGLYYYGYRYYLPWVCRWLSADRAGTVDGLNLFRMVRNNPIVWKDNDGRAPVNNVPLPPGRMPPPPPPGGGMMPPPPGMFNAAGNMATNAQKIFEPIELAFPVMPGNTASAHWRAEDYVNADALSSTISSMFGIEKRGVRIESVLHQEVFNQIRTIPGNEVMEFDSENLNANPAAWTSPQGIIYMGTTAPDYSSNGGLDVDKIRSTIVHESLHASSYRHTGFQAETDTSVTNSNYDEYITDFFAKKVFDKLFPGATYKTAYFTTNVGGKFMHWGGNLPKFMIDSGHITEKQLAHNYFNTGKLSALPESTLTKWRNFAKQNRNPLRY